MCCYPLLRGGACPYRGFLFADLHYCRVCVCVVFNAGISLAEVAASRGYKAVIVIPSSQSQEKKDALRFAGAELCPVPPKPYSNPNNYVRFGKRLADELGGVYMNQFDNPANRAAHVATTGMFVGMYDLGTYYALLEVNFNFFSLLTLYADAAFVVEQDRKYGHNLRARSTDSAVQSEPGELLVALPNISVA